MPSALQEKETEAQIQRAILDYLAYRNVFHWRANTGAGYFRNKGGGERFVRFGEKGMADIFCVVGGQVYGLEIKRSNGKQSAEQVEWQERFEKAGGVYILARSIDDVSKYL